MSIKNKIQVIDEMNFKIHPITEAIFEGIHKRIERLKEDLVKIQLTELYAVQAAEVRGRILELKRIVNYAELKDSLLDSVSDFESGE